VGKESTPALSSVGQVGFPRQVAWGWGATRELTSYLKKSDVNRPLIITDPGIVKAGVLQPVLDALGGDKSGLAIFDGTKPEPGLETVAEALEYGRSSDADVVVGVGGGSSLDVSKIVAVLLRHEASVKDVLGMGNMPGKGLPLVLVPTTTGTGSEVTQVSVLTDEADAGTKKVAYDPALLADLVIVDPYLSMNLPPAITAVTAIDALSHALEPFVSNRRNPIADSFAQEAIRRLSRHTRQAVLRGANCPEARYNVAIGATLAGFALSCGGAGATHALNYPLSVELHLGHGDSIARLLPYVMQANIASDPERYAEVAELMGATSTRQETSERASAEASVAFIVQLCNDINVKMGLSDLVGDDSMFGAWADIALEYSGHNIANNPRLLSKQDIIGIYTSALERIDR